MAHKALIARLQASACWAKDPYWNCTKAVRDVADSWNNLDGYQLLFMVPRHTLRTFYLLVAEALKDGSLPGAAADSG